MVKINFGCLSVWLISSICYAQIDTDYFPDFSVTDHAVSLQKSHCLASARAAEPFPDDTGRMLVARTTHRLDLVMPNGRTSMFQQLPFNFGGGSAGMNSFTFHPDFATQGAAGFGKYYTLTGDVDMTAPADFRSGNPDEGAHSILTEWTVSDVNSDTFSGTGRELIRFGTEGFGHVADDIEFGPDGLLYVAVGDDNEARLVSQDPQNVFGKILRIDPFGSDSANGQYGIPADNPFSNEVYAIGFRNPWRISFDSETGQLFVADVGQHSFEEVSLVTRGGNYGWPEKEGTYVVNSLSATLPNAVTLDVPDPDTQLTVAETLGLVDPIFQFDHSDGASIIGGEVYYGEAFPWLKGKYIFSSWDEGDVYFGDPVTGEVQLLMDKGAIAEFAGGAAVAIDMDLNGEILLLGTSCFTRLVPPLRCDFDGDAVCDVKDLDTILNQLGVSDSALDLDSSGVVDLGDRDAWLSLAGESNISAGYLLGDLDFDGSVDATDLNRLGRNWTRTGALGYAGGDLDGDSLVGSTDLNALAQNWNESSFAATNAQPVPEPCGLYCWGLALIIVNGLRSR